VGFLFFVASEVYFKEVEENKKQTREAGYGFHACAGFSFGMHAVNPFNGKKTKNKHAKRVMVSMLAQDFHLGCTQ
jgi:hypothetical protein